MSSSLALPPASDVFPPPGKLVQFVARKSSLRVMRVRSNLAKGPMHLWMHGLLLWLRWLSYALIFCLKNIECEITGNREIQVWASYLSRPDWSMALYTHIHDKNCSCDCDGWSLKWFTPEYTTCWSNCHETFHISAVTLLWSHYELPDISVLWRWHCTSLWSWMNAIIIPKHGCPLHVNMLDYATIFGSKWPWRRLLLLGIRYIGKESDFTNLSQHGSHTPHNEDKLAGMF